MADISITDVLKNHAGVPNTPRSVSACARLGYACSELEPPPTELAAYARPSDGPTPEDLWEARQKHARKVWKRKAKGVAKEHRKLVTFTAHGNDLDAAWGVLKVNEPWLPEAGDPTGRLKRLEDAGKRPARSRPSSAASTSASSGFGISSTGGAGQAAIEMMAKKASQIESQRLDAERKRVESSIKRQMDLLQKQVEAEKVTAARHAKLIAQEAADQKAGLAHAKVVAEAKKAAAAKKAEIEMAKHAKEEKLIAESQEMAKKEMEVEIKLAKERAVREEERKKQKRILEEEQAKADARRKAATMKIYDDLDTKAARLFQRLRERQVRVTEAAEARLVVKKEQGRREAAAAAERLEASMQFAEQKNIDKRVNYEARVEKHHARKIALVEERADAVAASAKALADKHDTQKQAYAQMKAKTAEFAKKTVQKEIDTRDYFKVVREERAYSDRRKHNVEDMRRADVEGNVARIKRINEAVRYQRMLACQRDDVRTDSIKDATEQMVRERLESAHVINTRKANVKEALEKMKATNDYSKLHHLKDIAMGQKLGTAQALEEAGEQA